MTTLFKTLAAVAVLMTPAMSFAEDAHHPPSATEGAPAVETVPKQATPDAMPAPGGGMMGGGMMGGDMMTMMQQMMKSHGRMMQGMMSADGMTGSGRMGQMMSPEHVEGRIAFLHTELKVTSAQEPLWGTVAEALREGARASGAMMQPAAGQTLPSVLESRERALSARLEAVRRLRAAVEPFYAALDETQKATADKLMEPMGMM